MNQKQILLTFLIIASCSTKTDRIYEKISTVKIGNTQSYFLNKMQLKPDLIMENDSIFLNGTVHKNLNKYVFFTELGAASDVNVYTRYDSVFYIEYD